MPYNIGIMNQTGRIELGSIFVILFILAVIAYSSVTGTGWGDLSVTGKALLLVGLAAAVGGALFFNESTRWPAVELPEPDYGEPDTHVRLRAAMECWEGWEKVMNKGGISSGWEGVYFAWMSLRDAALEVMEEDDIPDDIFKMIEKCWMLNEGTEDLRECCEKDLSKYRPALERLAKSGDAKARQKAEELLR